jgi:hypothetical protein
VLPVTVCERKIHRMVTIPGFLTLKDLFPQDNIFKILFLKRHENKKNPDPTT